VGVFDNKTNPITGTKDLWQKVHQVTGKTRRDHFKLPIDNINANSLNQHFADVSTDSQYETSNKKATNSNNQIVFDENIILNYLDKIKNTSMGMDELPSWYLRLVAPFLAEPVTYLFNLSLSQYSVPQHWKKSVITPVPKVPHPKNCQDYRPISITPILSRIFEKHIVRTFLYPILNLPDLAEQFADQFAFRPTGSTTAALINLLHQVSIMLLSNPFVHIIALDFSKAFDTVRHSTFLEKLAEFPVPDFLYNWIQDYLGSRQHCTKLDGNTSNLLPINSSLIQGSGIGPISFVLNSSDLHPRNRANVFSKYADDTYLIVPSSSSHTIPEELESIKQWAVRNNLKLNPTKSREMIVSKPHAR